MMKQQQRERRKEEDRKRERERERAEKEEEETTTTEAKGKRGVCKRQQEGNHREAAGMDGWREVAMRGGEHTTTYGQTERRKAAVV